MLIEQRVYHLKPGSLHEFLKIYEFEGLAIQSEALGNLIGYFQPQTGDLNRVIHLWGFESLEDRNSRRAALSANPKWREFLGKAGGFVTAQHAEILSGASFSPIR
ncbi:NIPSNAP family protein [Pseudomonas putida]|uniref:NIPSNAP family protein n=1 Tax=Pseudomonas putida TaxID=303 RepID=UPI0023647466|nr:NIPSNAP family protein [Pseudomonas putida]MDD2067776.1 NIPSNAP family protein [Pseudomonas putida]HDS1738336.1 NIPSNAP family protein [Pseudomonas putida]